MRLQQYTQDKYKSRLHTRKAIDALILLCWSIRILFPYVWNTLCLINAELPADGPECIVEGEG